MPKRTFPQPNKRLLFTLAAGFLCFAVCTLVWLAAVRGQGGKSLSTELSGDYTTSTAPIEGSVSQTFSFDEDLIALSFVFQIPGERPAGELHLTLADADTGEVLAVSTGEMGNILPGQYTGMGLDHTVPGQAGRRYLVTLTPAYTGAGRLALACSAEATLWDDTLTLDGAPQRGTAALMVSYRQIGGFLNRFYWAVAGFATLAMVGAVWLALGKKTALHRILFLLVLAFGLLWSAVLPPYAVPDEQYHINQSFTLACRWANRFTPEDWQMGHVPLESSYRRETDVDALLQNERTTVFTWQQASSQLLTRTDAPFDSHTLFEEAQVDNNPTLYLPSAAAVFLCYLLRMGFVPTLYAGRLVNLLLFALLAALAVRRAPFGKRVFFAAALLPMTLHLAASFSRDSLLLGLCFAFTALVLEAACGEGPLLVRAQLPRLLAAACFGLLLAPAKLVYLPLAALALAIPAARLGGVRRAAALKAGYLAACLLLALAVNRTVVFTASGTQGQASAAAADTEPAAAFPDAPAPAQAVSAGQPGRETARTALALVFPVGQTQFVSLNAVGAGGAIPEGSAVPTPDAAGPALPELSEADAALLAEPSAEGFVRRLFYYGEGRLDESANEVAFWADALRHGYVGGALLGQSFFFAPEDTVFGDSFVSGVSMAFFGYAILPGDVLGIEENMAAGNWEMVYKILYSQTSAASMAEQAGFAVGTDDISRFPLDRSELYAEVHAAIETDEHKSVATGDDAICFTPAYILHHLPQTAVLLVNSFLQNGDYYLRGLVGGILSYNSLELAWGWVAALYLLLAFAALPAAGAPPLPCRPRAALGLAALAVCALTVAGCVTWTPTTYTALYGLQGRYLLPALPAALLALSPRRLSLCGADGSCPNLETPLVAAIAAVNAGMLLNAMLTVIGR